MPWETEFWTETMRSLLASILVWLPSLAAALLLLLFGWMVAHLVQAILKGVLLRLGLDRLAERMGATRVLHDLGMGNSLVRPLARFAYWLVLLVFVLAAAESLGMREVTDTLRGVVTYLPKLLVAAVILLVGGLVARLLGNACATMAEQAGIRGGQAAGAALRYVLYVFIAILALGELGMETTLLVATTTILIASLAVILAVSFGWGSRGLARSIMAGLHVRDEFTLGQQLTVRGHTGRLVSIGPLKSLLETDAGLVSLPNHILVEEEVLIMDEGKNPE
jgi:small-conductance mechanosensitive channel